MKEQFQGFYSPTPDSLKAIWNDKNTIFVFDTNVFLNLYGYAEHTRGDFFKILQEIRDNLWIPFQVGLEYQRNRLNTVKNEKSVFKDIESNLEKLESVFTRDFSKLSLKRRFPKLAENTDKLEVQIKKSISDYRRSVKYWNDNQPCVRSHDPIRAELDIFFSDKVGPEPENQAWLDMLYSEGETRYENKIPPGFGDLNKEKSKEPIFYHNNLRYERKYGDLILWKQLLEKVKSSDIESVVMITDDSKPDWWYKISSNGEKDIGPLESLRTELMKDSKVVNFQLYNTAMFMQDSSQFLEVGVDKSSLSDVENYMYEFQKFDLPKLKAVPKVDHHHTRIPIQKHLRPYRFKRNKDRVFEDIYTIVTNNELPETRKDKKLWDLSDKEFDDLLDDYSQWEMNKKSEKDYYEALRKLVSLKLRDNDSKVSHDKSDDIESDDIESDEEN